MNPENSYFFSKISCEPLLSDPAPQKIPHRRTELVLKLCWHGLKVAADR
jgi:hypothetical protein